MTNEKKQAFTLRVSQANKTQMVTILYEIALSYLEDAQTALEAGDRKAARDAVWNVRKCISELIMSLNLETELARRLLSIYEFCNRQLLQASVEGDAKKLAPVRDILGKLCDAYRQIEDEDSSEPVMERTQTVYAGLTYGPGTLTESVDDPVTNRGFTV